MEILKGTIYRKEPSKAVTEKFTVQQIVLEVDMMTQTGLFTSYYPIQASNRAISLLEGVNVGDEVTVSVGINGRRFIRKDNGEEGFMVTLNLFKLDVARAKVFTNSGSVLDDIDGGMDFPDESVVASSKVGVPSGLNKDEDDTDLPF